MKKLILSATLLLSIASFAQKDELKTLKKIYSKTVITDKDLVEFKAASEALEAVATEESDKVYAKLYKVSYPVLELFSKGEKPAVQDQQKVYTDSFIPQYIATVDETIEYERKSGKKVHTDKLIEDKNRFRQGISSFAMTLNGSSKFKEASEVFYSLYKLDPIGEGKSLQNAAILATQAQDYVLAQKLYEEFYESDYFKNGTVYYAVSKASGKEEDLGSKELRTKYVGMGLYEKPRDEKVSSSKPEILKILSILYAQNNINDKEKFDRVITEARALLPDDKDLLETQFNLYFNQGYAFVKDDMKLVDEINNSTADKKKYDALMSKRKELFTKGLPFFEKAYKLKPADENTKNILKITYEIVGQPEKAKTIQ